MVAAVGPLLVIVGTTASGKSALALDVAERLEGEIICADSWTVYREFEIGTAKPSADDRARVPHHLLDVANPAEGFSAVVFQRLAHEAIAAIHGRGKLPIMVGGTGLYIDSVLYDYGFLPTAGAELRKELNGQTLAQLLARAEALGLDTSAIDRRNKRRVIRLIEAGGRLPTKKPMRANTVVCGLRLDKETLRANVQWRIDAMIRAGLEAEVFRLQGRYGWEVEPMKGIGYREWRDYFAGTQSLQDTKERITRATLALAKRQGTWFKRNNSIHWLDNSNKIAEAVDLATTLLNK